MKPLLLFLLCLPNLFALQFGNNYNYLNNTDLTLNETTVETVLKNFGEPHERYDIKSDKDMYIFLRYYMGDYGLFDGNMRLTYMEFKNNKLYAFIYGSNYKRDTTHFSLKRASNLKIGHTIKQAKDYLGTPTGESICPTNTGRFSGFCKKGVQAYAWVYADKGGLTKKNSLKIKIFLISIDADGRIIEIEKDRVLIKQWAK